MAWRRGNGRYGTVGNMDGDSNPAGALCELPPKEYNFYTNCIVHIHTKCDFFVFFKVCANKPRARSASREGKARAASA
jgi:hypothetical protein